MDPTVGRSLRKSFSNSLCLDIRLNKEEKCSVLLICIWSIIPAAILAAYVSISSLSKFLDSVTSFGKEFPSPATL